MTDTTSIRPQSTGEGDEPRAIDQITNHLATARFEDLPAADVELAKWRMLDVIGCAFGGASIDGNLEVLDLLRTWGGAEQATVIGHGGKLPVHHAALFNTFMVRSNDFEVMTFWYDGRRQPAHNSASTVPTALAIAESRGQTGRDLLTATMLGDDLAGRVALSSDWNFYLGPDGLGTLVPWGTTAVAGRLLGLTPEQLRHAFGLMVNMMAGTVQDYWDGSHAIKLVQGTASHTGI
ncbi:MAG: MmgE/PrpD family protein, partial [Pseudoclavibacter sp.]